MKNRSFFFQFLSSRLISDDPVSYNMVECPWQLRVQTPHMNEQECPPDADTVSTFSRYYALDVLCDII